MSGVTINAITFQRFATVAIYIYRVRTQTYVITVLQNACLLQNISNNSVVCLVAVRNHIVLSNYLLDHVLVKLSDLNTSDRYHRIGSA